MIRLSFALIGSNVKAHARLPNSIRGEIRHRLKFGLASGAKAVHVTNESRTCRQTSSKNLIDQMLQRFEQFAGLRLQQLRVVAFDIQHFAGDALLHCDAQLRGLSFRRRSRETPLPVEKPLSSN